jgi:hypothetical protein
MRSGSEPLLLFRQLFILYSKQRSRGSKPGCFSGFSVANTRYRLQSETTLKLYRVNESLRPSGTSFSRRSIGSLGQRTGAGEEGCQRH